jgi:hypothetical protein
MIDNIKFLNARPWQIVLICVAVAALSSCSVNNHNSKSGTTDSLSGAAMPDTLAKELVAVISIPGNVKVGDSVLLKFTVKNNTDSVQRFCKWHTPFEPLLSKYLDVKNDKGEDVAYQGAMAKRVMPPPASSYMSLNPKDSISANVDLLKAYAIKTPGNYTITYVGENISGLKVKNTISFIYR